MRIGVRLSVRLLDLPTLIEVRQETAGDKGQAVVALLRRTQEEKLKRRR